MRFYLPQTLSLSLFLSLQHPALLHDPLPHDAPLPHLTTSL